MDFNMKGREGKESSLSSTAMPSKEICILVQNIILPLPCGVLVLKYH